MSSLRRIAWIGSPEEGGGVGGMCRMFLLEFAREGVELDVYGQSELLPSLRAAFKKTETRFYAFPYSWKWDSWYGRNPKLAFIVSFIKRLRAYRSLVKGVVSGHRAKPYDAVIQFSQGELFGLGRYASEIPIILFPCVHAAGELIWCRRERELARECESAWWRILRDIYLQYRARLQKRDYHRARGVIGMSRRFNEHVARDYGLSSDRQGVVYHPIETKVNGDTSELMPPLRPVRLLFVGRISVRKGLDILLESLPRILSTNPSIEVTIIGAGSLWSNYEPLLNRLPTQQCRWLKSLPNRDVVREMQRSDVLLAPSQYEPGGIVVGEALANGMMVVVSDEVGSAENLPTNVCYKFNAGDVAAFEKQVARAIKMVEKDAANLRAEATAQARERFDPRRMAMLLLHEVSGLLGAEAPSGSCTTA